MQVIGTDASLPGLFPGKAAHRELTELVGRGGMAEVWRGVHVKERVPAAVKVITATMSLVPEVAHALKTEVRAVASLDHPNIVMVLDQGNVSRDAEQKSRGRFLAGNPYLVMELATGGTLDRVSGKLQWPHLRPLILVLLDALAHAHSGAMTHTDTHREIRTWMARVSIAFAFYPRAFMFVADVALGKCHVASGAKGYTKAPTGTHSVFGKMNKTGSWGGSLMNNEFIVYKANQNRLRYLVEFEA